MTANHFNWFEVQLLAFWLELINQVTLHWSCTIHTGCKKVWAWMDVHAWVNVKKCGLALATTGMWPLGSLLKRMWPLSRKGCVFLYPNMEPLFGRKDYDLRKSLRKTNFKKRFGSINVFMFSFLTSVHLWLPKCLRKAYSFLLFIYYNFILLSPKCSRGYSCPLLTLTAILWR